MNVNEKSFLVKSVLNIIQHYNHKKYWGMRKEVINPKSKKPKIIRLYYLLLIKKMDSYNNASMGTHFGYGAYFATPPRLMHGLNGIIISHKATIGENCIIYHQVTIGNSFDEKAATIGDNCFIGAGAKIIGGIHIGNNVKIGANAVVVKDVPDNCTVVGSPAYIVRMNATKTK